MQQDAIKMQHKSPLHDFGAPDISAVFVRRCPTWCRWLRWLRCLPRPKRSYLPCGQWRIRCPCSRCMACRCSQRCLSKAEEGNCAFRKFANVQKMGKTSLLDFEFPSLPSLRSLFNLITTVCAWLVEHVSLSHHRPSTCVLPGATNPPDETVYQWEPQSGARTHCHLFQRT